MADNFRDVSRGEPITRIGAGMVNGWNAAARQARARQFSKTFDASVSVRSSAIVDVRNVTGGALDRFSVLVLRVPAITPADNLNEALSRPCMDGETPGSASAHEPVVVLLDPIPDNKINRAVLVGATWVKVIVAVGEEDWKFADVTSGVTSNMVMSPVRGPARILWKESGVGTKWAYVFVGGGQSGDGWTWKTKTGDYNPAVGEAVRFDVSGGILFTKLPAAAVVNDEVMLCPLYTGSANRLILSGILDDGNPYTLNGVAASGNNLGTGYASGEGGYVFVCDGSASWTCLRPLS